MVDAHLARKLWWALEPYHAVVYFAPEAKATFEQIGLKGFWMGYFASRAAPLGAVPAEVVIATFYNFHPDMVRRAIPDAWQRAAPRQISAARLALVDQALRHLLSPEVIDSEMMRETAQWARRAADAASPLGRPLFAAYTALDWPTEPHLALWHAATLLREHRGDGHVATLIHADINACEAHLLAIASGVATREVLHLSRRWPDEAWDEATARLQARGWLDAEGTFTPQGAAAKQRLEDDTDALALAPFARLSKAEQTRLLMLMQAISHHVVVAGGVPFPNPMGLPHAKGNTPASPGP